MASFKKLNMIRPLVLIAIAPALSNCELDVSLKKTDEVVTSRSCGNLAVGETEERIRFESALVADGQSCNSQKQISTCTDGAMSSFVPSNFQELSCSIAVVAPPVTPTPTPTPKNCGSIVNGSTIEQTRFQAASVASGETCKSQKQISTCNDGMMSSFVPSNYQELSCFVNVPTLTSWNNRALQVPSNSDAIELNFFVSLDAALGDTVIGLSNGGIEGNVATDTPMALANYQKLATILRFNTNGAVDARNGGSYTSSNNLSYVQNQAYEVNMKVDLVKHIYRIEIGPEGQSKKLIADDFAFRSENAQESNLDTLSFYSNNAVVLLEDLTITKIAQWTTTPAPVDPGPIVINPPVDPGPAPTPVGESSCASGSSSTIQQYGITWTFNKAYTCGRFVNGDYWVVGPVVISNISPKGGNYNGTMLNPVPHTSQGFYDVGTSAEHRATPYVSSLDLTKNLPATVQGGNSVVSTIQNPDTWAAAPVGEKVWFKETAVLTVLSSAPAADSFRMPYAGYSGKSIKSNWKFSSVNFGALRQLAPPIAGNVPNLAWLEEATKRPLLEMHRNYLNSNWKAGWAETKTGGYPRRTYGREVSHISSGAGLFLMTNASNQVKQKLLINMVQWGIDISGLIKAGMKWEPNGGHNHGRLLPLYIAAKVLGDSEMLAQANGKNDSFQEFSQHYIVTQADINRPREGTAQAYPQSSLGMAEWTSGGLYEQAKGSYDWNATGYRFINGAPNAAVVAVILLMGGRTEINHEPLMQYMIKRYYPVSASGAAHTLPSYGDSITLFTRDMWNQYLSNVTN